MLSMSLCSRLEEQIRLEHRITFTLRLAHNLVRLRESGPDRPELCVANAAAEVVDCLSKRPMDSRVRARLCAYLQDQQLQQYVAAKPYGLAQGDQAGVAQFLVDFLYESLGGGQKLTLQLQDAAAEAVGLEAHQETSRGRFVSAFLRPEELEAECRRMEGLADVGGVGFGQELREMHSALQIRRALEGDFNLLQAVLLKCLSIRREGEPPILLDFVRELVILRQFAPVLSERIQKRFAERFRCVRENALPEQYRDAMLNTIGEFVLASLGIVAPSLFQIMQREIDQLSTLIAEQACDESDYDLQQAFGYWKLKPRGTIFWNRWAVRGQRPSPLTDDLIRRFLTQTVRKSGEDLLAAIAFDQIVAGAKEVTRDNSAEDREDELRSLLLEHLELPAFLAAISEHMRTDWYRQLAVFWPNR